MAVILIDSNLWLYGRTEAREQEFAEIHRRTKAFLDARVADPEIRIGITTYHAAEILDLWRKARVPEADRRKLFSAFFSEKFIRTGIDDAALQTCGAMSLASGIHIYDYLVALPLKGLVDRIYSADDHFQHPHFTSIAPVENPVAPWVLREGRRPAKA